MDPRAAAILFILTLYLVVVRLLRFRNLNRLQKKYSRFVAKPYDLDHKTAHEIIQVSLRQEFPFAFAYGTQWALLKSYGIANGTPLLVKTGQLTREDKVGKRAEDTGIFVIEFLVGDIDSDRGCRAISKMNWMHGRYRITPTDYIHTLSLFVLEPLEWAEKYEWRVMSELEKVAYFVYWKEIGNRMGLEDVPETIEDLRKWKIEYEKKNLVYAKTNTICADATVGLFLRNVPGPFKPFFRTLVISLLGETKYRQALGYDEPPFWANLIADNFFYLRGFIIRHFALPRFTPINPLPKPGPDGRLHRDVEYVGFEPWYVKDTWWSRLKLWSRSGGRITPGSHFKDSGYLPEELGPLEFENMSKEGVFKQAAAMKTYSEKGGGAVVGCPFRFRP